MKNKILSRTLLLVTLFVLVSIPAQTVVGAPPQSDTGEGNKVWFSVTNTNYEVALQVSRSWGWETIYTRDHNTARNAHPFDFYNLGRARFRVLLSKRNGVYVNLPCGSNINFSSVSNKMIQRSCP